MIFPPHLLREAFAQVSSLFILQMAHFCELRVTPVDPPVLSGMTHLPGGCWHRFPEPPAGGQGNQDPLTCGLEVPAGLALESIL